ncbi:sugar ABC transporter substrate-binding protein [Methylopila musalis]|uniref:Sugar ABC transporter substrate-binding protein n=1 Tax=Methylopila musalis TaxID=1134781 RepID=A0ABW3Z378_9HYPH
MLPENPRPSAGEDRDARGVRPSLRGLTQSSGWPPGGGKSGIWRILGASNPMLASFIRDFVAQSIPLERMQQRFPRTRFYGQQIMGEAGHMIKNFGITKSAAMFVLAASCGLVSHVNQAEAQTPAEMCKKNYKIGYSHPVSEAKAVQAVAKYAKKRATDLGCVDLLIDATTNLNLQTQRAAVENWILQGVDAIVIRAVDPSAFVGLQKEAQAKGIKWLTYTKPMKGQDGSVGWNTDKAGELVAAHLKDWAKTHIAQGGVSSAVTELSIEPSLKGQWEFPKAALKDLGVPIVLAQDCADQECGLAMAETALRENPNLRIFIAGSTDDPGVGAARAFRNAGIAPEDVYIGGMDGSEQALVEIKKGTYYKSTAAIRLDLLGYSIVDASINAVNGAGPTDIVSPNEIATTADMSALEKLIAVYK